MKRIIAIGGGEIKQRQTLKIDKYIVDSAGEKNPRLLFVPTASSDAEGYVEAISSYFGDELGCSVEALLLCENKDSKEKIRKKILESDIVYVGGGNTRMMLEIWKKNNVHHFLKEAYHQGTILCGLSAGSICWFDCGQSDSDLTDSDMGSPYSIVEGLGFIPMIHSPHHNEDFRNTDFDRKISDMKLIGLALSNNCAIEICDDGFRIMKSRPEAYALKIFRSGNRLVKEELNSSDVYESVDKLYE